MNLLESPDHKGIGLRFENMEGIRFKISSVCSGLAVVRRNEVKKATINYQALSFDYSSQSPLNKVL